MYMPGVAGTPSPRQLCPRRAACSRFAGAESRKFFFLELCLQPECDSCAAALRRHRHGSVSRQRHRGGGGRGGSAAAALLTRFLNTNLRPFPLVTTVAVMRRAQEYQRGSFKKNKAQEEQEEQRAERISGSLEADPPDEPIPGLSMRNAMAAATAVVIVALLIAYFRT
jgi:hypothetical protein